MPSFNLAQLKNKHFLSLVGNIVMSMFGLLLFGMLYKAFSKDDMGTWIYFMATQGLLDSIRNGFLGTATIKFYAGAEKGRAADVLGSVWYLAIAVTGLMCVLNVGALACLSFISDFPTIVTIKWVGLTMLSSLPYSVIFWKLQADERYDTILWMRFINSGSTIISFFVLIYLHQFTLNNALLWNLVTNALTSVVGMAANLGGFHHIRMRTKNTVMEVLHFGKYSLASSLSSSLLGAVNTYMINFMLGPAAVAVYGVANKLMELVEIPLRSFVGTGISGMAAAFNQNNMHQVKYIMNKYAGMLTWVFIPLAIGTFFLADIPVNILSSGKYAGTEAANIFRILMVIAILYPIDRFNGVALDVIHQPKVNFYKVQVMLFVKIVGNYVFISLMHNVYGVPASGALTVLAGLVFGYAQLRKFMEFSIRDIIASGWYELKALMLKMLGRQSAA
jgi:O-antigen/teichoic acid export membrane protein